MFENGRTVPFDEDVNVRQGRSHPRGQRGVAGAGSARVGPGDPVGQPVQHHDGAAGGAALFPLVEDCDGYVERVPDSLSEPTQACSAKCMPGEPTVSMATMKAGDQASRRR